MKKYIAAYYGTAANQELVGCKYYKNKGIHANATLKNPDLLEGLEITVNDTSGISEVKIEIGSSCVATYSLPTDIASIVASSTSATGVKPSYKNIVLKYALPSTNGGAGTPGQGLPPLLAQFGKTGPNARLDECLTEGKNYMVITVKDNARSNADGVVYAPNTTVLNYSSSSQFIKIDNTGSKIGFTGDTKDIAQTNATNMNCFI